MMKKTIVLAISVLLCSAAFVFAADQDQNRTRQQKRVKDGSGQITQPAMEQNELAGDTDRDRKRDGSCDITQSPASGLLAADTTRSRDRKRDGSCKNSLSDPDGTVLAADKTRDRDRKRKRDGSCQG